MAKKRVACRAVLLAVAVACGVAVAVPPFGKVWPEPTVREDLFYYVDYHKSDAYQQRLMKGRLWPWVVGLGLGAVAGLGYYLVYRARPESRSS